MAPSSSTTTQSISQSESQSTTLSSSSSNRSALTTRIISGSIGSLITSVVVTPLDVVKVRLQAYQQGGTTATASHALRSASYYASTASFGSAKAVATTATATATGPAHVPISVACPGGCGTFVLYNGHMDCLLPRSAVPYFCPTTGKLTEQAARICDSSLNRIRNSNSTGGSMTSNWKSSAASASTSAATAKSATATTSAATTSPRGTLTMLRTIFMEEGLGGIYAGLRPTLVMAVPSTVLYYSAYDELIFRYRQSKLQQQGHQQQLSGSSMPTWVPLMAGGSARVVSTVVVAPLEFLRTRQASVKGGMTSAATTTANNTATTTTTTMWHELSTIIRNEGGPLALYKGLGPSLWRDVPFSAIYWLCLERFRDMWQQAHYNDYYNHYNNHNNIHNHNQPSALEQTGQSFINGAAAGMIAAAFTTPFDVVKTRLQQQQANQYSFPTSEGLLQQQQRLRLPFGSNNSNSNMVSSASSRVLAAATTTNSMVAVAGAGAPTGATMESPRAILCSSCNGSTTTSTTTTSSTSTFSLMRRIVKEEGIGGLWRGNMARMLKVAPACAIMLSSYELGKRLLETD